MPSLLHPQTKKLLSAVEAAAPHALILTGPVGIGLTTVALETTRHFEGDVVTLLPEKDSAIDLDKGTITIESIRQLYETTRTRHPRGRIVIIDYAERMAAPAQNAFLKLLEEPGEGTRFILLTHDFDAFLPTIRSRAQRIDIRPITPAQSADLLDTLGVKDATRRTQLLFIASGLPAELTRLAGDDAAFEARATVVKDARSLVAGTGYDRLLLARKYKDSRPTALLLVEDAMRLLRRTLAASGDSATLRMLTRLELIHRRLTEQGNVRLQLSSTVVL